MSAARSLLFAPGDDERKLLKALQGDADAVVADLEDAVAPEAKAGARDVTGRAFGAALGRGGALVRVNALETAWARDDLDWVRRLAPEAVLIPKATPSALAGLSEDLPPVIAILETAEGVHRAYDVACHPGVVAVVLGALDLSAEIGFRWTADGSSLLYARSKVVLESAAAGIRPPIDTAWTKLADVDGLLREAEQASGLGFGGKCCIHPSQIAVVNEAFSDADDLAWARRVTGAYAEALDRGEGVIVVDGEMVDMASLRRARRLLDGADATLGQGAGG
jgi:citrate lyase beta subunit